MTWEAEIVCDSCSGTHQVHAEHPPRAFVYVCPVTGDRVRRPFRDPSRTTRPWTEVPQPSPGSIQALFTEEQGQF